MSSGTSIGTTISDAATQNAASTMVIQFIVDPATKAMIAIIKIGTMNAPETADPTIAVRRLNCLTPYSMTDSFSLCSVSSISVFSSLPTRSRQAGHS